jgi:hypothetical protein
LTQLVLETGNAAKFLPVQLLTQMIRLSDDALAEFFSRYVTGALDMYLQARRGVQAMTAYNPLAQIPVAASDALARMWMSSPFGNPYQTPPFGQGYAAPPAGGFPAPPPPPESEAVEPTPPPAPHNDDVGAMRKELDELKQMLRDNLPARARKKRKS